MHLFLLNQELDNELLRRAAEGNDKKTKQNKLRCDAIMFLSMVFKRVWDIYFFDQQDKFSNVEQLNIFNFFRSCLYKSAC